MKVYHTSSGLVMESQGQFRSAQPKFGIDALFTERDPAARLQAEWSGGSHLSQLPPLRPPLSGQEVWAAGVTYFRSKTARMAEAKDGGGGSFYDKVYSAERPELFFKASAHRVAASGEAVRIRRDAHWNVPEPELTLALNSEGKIFGYTIGNDMSSRDIEGENPLYLPQAKVYYRSSAVGPCLLITDSPPPPETEIRLWIHRAKKEVFAGQTQISQIKRSFTELASFLFREERFPQGVLLMTGTGIVPSDDFTLRSGDEISIEIAPIGKLVNVVE